ncbi:unnamed protein product [Ilex paraguariensis]|uniref:Uncharacterized protein n=1 Tax=Ilex paraguariensis TaxID=185542 RepID=A0ABC8R9G4_9AQUA
MTKSGTIEIVAAPKISAEAEITAPPKASVIAKITATPKRGLATSSDTQVKDALLVAPGMFVAKDLLKIDLRFKS